MKSLSLTPLNIEQTIARRKFIVLTIKSCCATAIIGLPSFVSASGMEKDITIQEVIDIILKEIPGAPFDKTVDTIKSGSAANKLTGIVTTMFATVAVINEAIRLKANFIIAHEPSFYNHTDDKKFIDKNDVLAQKLELLVRNNITIWRFHDYWHTHQPDGIMYGVVKKAGWESYFKQGQPVLNIPGDSLKNIALHLKAKLAIEHLRVIGDPGAICKKIALLPGASGGKNQLSVAETEKPDLLIVGELQEWETAEYIRDAGLLGNKISLIVLGHAVSEEPGMEWLVEWLQPKVPAIKITHVASQDPFVWM